MRVIDEVRRAIAADASSGVSRDHVLVLYRLYDELMMEVLRMARFLEEPGRSAENKLDIAAAVGAVARDQEARFPRVALTSEEQALREHVRGILDRSVPGEASLAALQGHARLIARLLGMELPAPRRAE